MAIKNPPAQKIPQWFPFDDIHGRHHVLDLLNVKSVFFQKQTNALFRINPRMGPALVQGSGQPTKKGHPIPWQQWQFGSVGLKNPPFVGN
jgi:hypothetical protein